MYIIICNNQLFINFKNSENNMMNLDSSESLEYQKPKISNLTKNLQNSHYTSLVSPKSRSPLPQSSTSIEESSNGAPSNIANPGHTASQSVPNNPPSYYLSVRDASYGAYPPHPTLHSSIQGNANLPQNSLQQNSLQQNSFHQLHPSLVNSFNQNSLHQPYSSDSYHKRDSVNYIPSSHNTPNMVSSSYSSNNSYKYGAFKPSHSIPTTNVTTDNNFIPNFQRQSGSFSFQPGSQQPQNQFQNLLSQPQQLNQFQRPAPFHQHLFTTSDNLITNITPTPPQAMNYVTEPDHYMSYNEFFHNLSMGDTEDEHINIVDYPVNDLILMLSCLLTKIIEANDKLHPNHFSNTIAMCQKSKEEKRKRRLEKQSQKLHDESEPIKMESNRGININESIIDEDSSEDDEDDDDEMKNRYLTNVLAFHGTNVPGISLHAYLSRVLKYCPVTNEVFLSLLVYFDRIAKKANNLKKEGDNDNEQLFVMDSYNIHRLIISGITVLSKFFSDIFYKNLRYAKVGGLPLEELNYLELQFLLLLDFKLMISVEDLQNYGDLLLRFWKREQITNELVTNPREGQTNQDKNQPVPSQSNQS